MSNIFTILFFLLSILFFHSCRPFGDQRDVLSLSRADNEVIHNYKSSFENSDIFLTTTKTCPHCGKLVSAETSIGECMFMALAEEADEMPPEKLRAEAKKVRTQLRGEAEEGHGPANNLLGIIAENGLFGFGRDTIAAARYYRLFAETGTADGYAALAAFWLRTGDYLPKAVALLEKAQKMDPRNTHFSMLLSEAYMRQDRPKEAFEAAKRAYYHSPINSAERDSIELIFVDRLMQAASFLPPEEAVSQINDLIYLAPKNKDLVFARANLYLLLEKFDLAKKDIESLSKDYPELPLKLFQVRLNVAQGNYKSAYDKLNRLAEENPGDFSVRELYLRTLVRENRWKEAADAAAKYIETDSDKTAAYLFRARFRLENNMLKEAIEDFEAASRTAATPEVREQLEKEILRLKHLQESQLHGI